MYKGSNPLFLKISLKNKKQGFAHLPYLDERWLIAAALLLAKDGG